VRPRANAHNMLLCFKRLVGGPAPADIVKTIINHKSTQNSSRIVHSDSPCDVICNGLATVAYLRGGGGGMRPPPPGLTVNFIG